MALVTLETPRLWLVPSTPEDAAAVLDFYARNQAHLMRWDPPWGDDFLTLDFHARRLERDQRASAEDLGYRWWLRPREAPERVIGQAHLSAVIRGAMHGAMLGYALDAQCEGQGLMTEALRAVIAAAFSRTLNLHRIQANHRPENHRSAAVLQRLGFAREGLARDYLFIDGAWRDHAMTALVNPDWRIDDAR